MIDALAPYRRRIILALVLLALAGAGYGLYALHSAGVKQGELQCGERHLQAVVTTEAASKKETRADIVRSQRTGAAREQGRRALDALFEQLNQEAHDAPADPVDTCVLPADRLLIWNAANAGGTGASAPAAQPDSTPLAAATGSFWPSARLGSQPPPGGSAIPPTSPAAMPAAGLPATHAP